MRSAWRGPAIVAVLVGGAAGAALRWGVLTSVTSGRFPWPVLALNVGGSLLLGLLLAVESARPRARVLLHDAGAIGFCGGLTTFSTFAVEVVELVKDHEVAIAASYVTTSVVGAVAGVVAGAATMRRAQAASTAVEERP